MQAHRRIFHILAGLALAAASAIVTAAERLVVRAAPAESFQPPVAMEPQAGPRPKPPCHPILRMGRTLRHGRPRKHRMWVMCPSV